MAKLPYIKNLVPAAKRIGKGANRTEIKKSLSEIASGSYNVSEYNVLPQTGEKNIFIANTRNNKSINRVERIKGLETDSPIKEIGKRRYINNKPTFQNTIQINKNNRLIASQKKYFNDKGTIDNEVVNKYYYYKNSNKTKRVTSYNTSRKNKTTEVSNKYYDKEGQIKFESYDIPKKHKTASYDEYMTTRMTTHDKNSHVTNKQETVNGRPKFSKKTEDEYYKWEQQHSQRRRDKEINEHNKNVNNSGYDDGLNRSLEEQAEKLRQESEKFKNTTTEKERKSRNLDQQSRQTEQSNKTSNTKPKNKENDIPLTGSDGAGNKPPNNNKASSEFDDDKNNKNNRNNKDNKNEENTSNNTNNNQNSKPNKQHKDEKKSITNTTNQQETNKDNQHQTKENKQTTQNAKSQNTTQSEDKPKPNRQTKSEPTPIDIYSENTKPKTFEESLQNRVNINNERNLKNAINNSAIEPDKQFKHKNSFNENIDKNVNKKYSDDINELIDINKTIKSNNYEINKNYKNYSYDELKNMSEKNSELTSRKEELSKKLGLGDNKDLDNLINAESDIAYATERYNNLSNAEKLQQGNEHFENLRELATKKNYYREKLGYEQPKSNKSMEQLNKEHIENLKEERKAINNLNEQISFGSNGAKNIDKNNLDLEAHEKATQERKKQVEEYFNNRPTREDYLKNKSKLEQNRLEKTLKNNLDIQNKDLETLFERYSKATPENVDYWENKLLEQFDKINKTSNDIKNINPDFTPTNNGKAYNAAEKVKRNKEKERKKQKDLEDYQNDVKKKQEESQKSKEKENIINNQRKATEERKKQVEDFHRRRREEIDNNKWYTEDSPIGRFIRKRKQNKTQRRQQERKEQQNLVKKKAEERAQKAEKAKEYNDYINDFNSKQRLANSNFDRLNDNTESPKYNEYVKNYRQKQEAAKKYINDEENKFKYREAQLETASDKGSLSWKKRKRELERDKRLFKVKMDKENSKFVGEYTKANDLVLEVESKYGDKLENELESLEGPLTEEQYNSIPKELRDYSENKKFVDENQERYENLEEEVKKEARDKIDNEKADVLHREELNKKAEIHNANKEELKNIKKERRYYKKNSHLYSEKDLKDLNADLDAKEAEVKKKLKQSRKDVRSTRNPRTYQNNLNELNKEIKSLDNLDRIKQAEKNLKGNKITQEEFDQLTSELFPEGKPKTSRSRKEIEEEIEKNRLLLKRFGGELAEEGEEDIAKAFKNRLGKAGKVGTAFALIQGIGQYKDSRKEGKSVASSSARAVLDFAASSVLSGKVYMGLTIAKEIPTLALKGVELLNKEVRAMNTSSRFTVFGEAQFQDTEQLATMRQSGLEMAKMSQYRLEQTLMGNEAKYLHS